MKKCSRVKNPCKICLQSVTNKTGLQCKGACKKWAHFACLHYTPGKIHDIKAGLITVTCPCPNCNTQEPKEFLTNPPYTCTNQQCPANKLPQCQINECPLNKLVMSRGVSPRSTQMGPPPCGPACSQTRVSQHTPPTSSPEMTNIPVSLSQPVIDDPCIAPAAPPMPSCMSHPIMADAVSPKVSPRRRESPMKITSQREILAHKTTSPHLKSRSCSCMSGFPGNLIDAGSRPRMKDTSVEYMVPTQTTQSGDCKASCSDSKLSNGNNKESQNVLLCTIQELCSTVGQLSTQIKALMCKMMDK